jgi:hypothetical protein
MTKSGVERDRFPNLASMRGRIGAYRLHAMYDARDTTRNARAAFMSRWDREVDPEGKLQPSERERRATAARKAYFVQLAYRSAIVRSRGARNGF